MITATYRLQLRPATTTSAGFTFADAAGLVPYLGKLGVTHLYLSPFLTAVDGSTHGYDVVDPTAVSTELGGLEGLHRLAEETRRAGLGLIGDIVPNHMGVANPSNNRWWWDVLTHGPASRYASYFDIDWEADPDRRLRLPSLGSEDDLTGLVLDGDVLRLHGTEYPIAPGTHHGTAREVHDQQHYRLIDWRTGPNFRRFLGINELAALRQEEERVFAATHQLIGELVADGVLDGVRVDHLDGLADPITYLRRLRDLLGDERLLVIEKVIAPNEELPAEFPVDGTTGYEVLREIGALFNYGGAAEPLGRLAEEITGSRWDTPVLQKATRELKIAALDGPLEPELKRLARAVQPDPASAAATRAAITETIAELPVYRADTPDHMHHLETALDTVSDRDDVIGTAADTLREALNDPAVRGRFSQLSAGAMSIATEGPLSYRAARLVSLLEMGGDATRISTPAADLHAFLGRICAAWPRTMTTLSTHDAKRGEDVRARISVLTQVPEQFGELARELDAVEPAPDRATGYTLLQSLIGVWPESGPAPFALRERFAAFARKAVREAGVHTDWSYPNEAFESSLNEWAHGLFEGSSAALLSHFVAKIAPHAHAVSLGQKLFQLAGPGIPDVYQGTEMWEDSLTDPDNRRFISYERFQFALRNIDSFEPTSGEPINWTKLRLVRAALTLRRERPSVFVGGDYHPLVVDQPYAAGFIRATRGGPAEVCALASLFTAVRPADIWEATEITLPDGRWRDSLTGQRFSGTVAAPTLFETYPVALLVRA